MKLSDFSAAMVAGCEAALDAGVFYQEAFCDFVIKHMGGFDCTPNLVEVIECDFGAKTPLASRIEVDDFVRRIAALPRGNYGVVRRVFEDGHCSFSTLVSDGSGKLAVGGSYDRFDSHPAADHVMRRMVGYEIYLCRGLVERARQITKDVAQMHRFCVGQVFKNYKHPSEIKPYSKAKVAEVFSLTGGVKLILTKRGSAKRYEVSVGASFLADRVFDKTV